MSDLANRISAITAAAKLDVMPDRALLDAQGELMWLHGQIQRELIKREDPTSPQRPLA